MRWMLAGALAMAALAACSPGDTQQERAAQAQAKGDWQGFVDATLEQWFRLDPAFAVERGRHDFEGQLPDWSAAGLARRAAFLKDTIRRARAFNALNPAAQFERDYLVKVAEGQLFWLEDADWPGRNPAFYVQGGLDPGVYVTRRYADPATRMRAVIGFLKNVPAAAGQIRANLRQPLPESLADYGIAAFDGLASHYRGDVRRAFAGVGGAAQQRELAEASDRAAQAMAGLAGWLRAGRTNATQDFALGPERFARMLRATEAVDVPLDALEAAGRADLERNQAALRTACAGFAPGKSVAACLERAAAITPEGGPVAAARRQLPALRRFVVEHDLVSIPDGATVQVAESLPDLRRTLATIHIPGPYEHGIPSIYAIAPSDPTATPDVGEAASPSEAGLLLIGVRQVWPGHFLRSLHSNRARSRIGRLFAGRGYAEGWAHYAEEMLVEAGLGEGNPATRIGQLSNALLRNCRYLSAIGLHARGMTQAESQKLFQEQCWQPEANARQEAARGTYDPAYLSETLGKLMIRKLRDDWTASRGGLGAWKAFHDRFLGFGGPPVPLVRRAMMNEPTAQAVF